MWVSGRSVAQDKQSRSRRPQLASACGSAADKGDGFEDKVAAIGVRLKRWVSLYGIAINVEPDLTHFDSIVPCGVADPRYGVTSLVDLGLPVTMADLDVALKRRLEIFLRRRLISARPGCIGAS